MRCLIDGAYLDLTRMDWLQSRPLDDISENELLTALKREARVSEEAPSLAEFCPVAREAARIESRWPIEKRIAHVRRNVQDCLQDRDWESVVIQDNRWTPEDGRATVAALMDGLWPRDFKD